MTAFAQGDNAAAERHAKQPFGNDFWRSWKQRQDAQARAQAQSDMPLPHERYLLFTAAELGLCALPIASVLNVSRPDGPCRSIPGRGGSGSRFCGLVSVRGQVHLCFDLLDTPAQKTVHPGVPADMAETDAARTDIARVDTATRTDTARIGTGNDGSERNNVEYTDAENRDAEAWFEPSHEDTQPLVVAVNARRQTLALHVAPPLRFAPEGEILDGVPSAATGLLAELVSGRLLLENADGAGETPVWVLDVERLFARLEKEVGDDGS